MNVCSPEANKLAREIVDDILSTTLGGPRADRLRLMSRDQEVGTWSEQALIDRVARIVEPYLERG